MKVQIGNQLISINEGKTVITVIRPPDLDAKDFVHKLNFDFRKYPEESELIKKTNFAEYWWLSTLFNDFTNMKNGIQLTLFNEEI